MDPDDSNFYSQMAASLDSNSFDDSDEEEVRHINIYIYIACTCS